MYPGELVKEFSIYVEYIAINEFSTIISILQIHFLISILFRVYGCYLSKLVDYNFVPPVEFSLVLSY